MAFVNVGIIGNTTNVTSSSTPTNKSTRQIVRASYSTQPTTRRAFLLGVIATTTTVFTQKALAQVDTMTEEGATQVINQVREEITDLNSAANLGEYEALRLELRKGSFGRIRIAGTTLSKTDETRAAYRNLISKVELLDSHALRAERGGDTKVVASDISEVQNAVDNLLSKIEK